MGSFETKRCSGCKRTLPASEFNKHSKRKDGLQNYCRECAKEASRKGYHETNYYRRVIIQRRYGITQDEYDAMHNRQGGVCVICGATGRLVIDHDHTSGDVRGLLCDGCNVTLGRLNDDKRVVASMLAYLENHG